MKKNKPILYMLASIKKYKEIFKTNNLHSYCLEIPSSIERLSTVDLFLEKIQKIHHLNEDIFIKMDVILNESVNNAIIHGNKLEANKRVAITVNIDENEINIIVTDEGTGFDYKYILNDNFDNNIHKIQERGLFIIKNLSHKLNFNNQGNAIYISIGNNK